MMIGIIVFVLVWLFIIVPLYKAVRKTAGSRALNDKLVSLANQYERHLMRGNSTEAQSCLEQARASVRQFFPDIVLTPQELAQVAPAITRFPNWQSWL